jgi:branched-chain amino acid transport system permease protein
MNYYYFLGTTILINVLLSTSLGVVLGQAGILSLAHSAFMSVGAYFSSFLILQHGAGYVTALLGGLAAGFVIGIVVSWLSSLLPESDHILFYLAAAVLATEVAAHWTSITGGPNGLVGIPRPTVLGHTFATQQDYMWLVAVVVALGLLVILRFSSSRFGLVVRAMRDDPVACRAAGWRTLPLQMTVFAVGSAMAAVAGVLYAGQLQFIQSGAFEVHLTLLVLIFVVVGGMGNVYGAALGAVLLTALPELLNKMALDPTVQALLNQVIVGLILIAFIRWRPSGILPERPVARAPKGALS